MRLNKAIALSGLCSRRKADALIEKGRVLVNNQAPESIGMQIDNDDCIKVDQKKICLRKEHLYFLCHKPIGYVCSKRRLYPKQKILYDILDAPGLFTVGRLDKDTTGLIILTTDGAIAQKIIHPSSAIEKEYLVKLEALTRQSIQKILNGIVIDGVHITPKSVELIDKDLLKIIIMEGKNREIRRLCQHAQLKIKSLKRVRIGNVKLEVLQEHLFIQIKKKHIYALFDGNKSALSSK